MDEQIIEMECSCFQNMVLPTLKNVENAMDILNKNAHSLKDILNKNAKDILRTILDALSLKLIEKCSNLLTKSRLPSHQIRKKLDLGSDPPQSNRLGGFWMSSGSDFGVLVASPMGVPATKKLVFQRL